VSVTPARRVEPIVGPLDATVRPPGSKSITNRALVCAALADGRSTLTGALSADDTDAMVACLRALGIDIATDPSLTVTGSGGRIPHQHARLDVRQSGTTARFVTPVAALGHGTYEIDGAPRMRERPMADLTTALRSLGVDIDGDHLPLTVHANGLAGGHVALAADVSSQFVSGLLLAAPAMSGGLVAELTTTPVSRPYLDLTLDVMRAFGGRGQRDGEHRFVVAPSGYRATDYIIEADASAASYFFAAAAIVGGRVTVAGLASDSAQGDIAFVDVLVSMGAEVRADAAGLTVVGSDPLHGTEVNLANLSDTVPTLAVVAAFATSPTRITGVGFIRAKESDRIGAVVAELRRLGIEADQEPDGLVVRPGPITPARVETYDDHRIAMAFALVGLRIPGIEISDPGCVAKTYPGYFEALEALRVR
jgi:3-phosphoshikimate 1-carboxyvinyltransferase